MHNARRADPSPARNLNRAFGQSEEPSVSAEDAARLSKLEQELLTVTTEFTAGLEERFGPVPVLHSAMTSMEAAVADLDRKAIARAVPDEESALASLIKARQNLRKFLKEKSSATASRQFDRMERQKLPSRRPRRTKTFSPASFPSNSRSSPKRNVRSVTASARIRGRVRTRLPLRRTPRIRPQNSPSVRPPRPNRHRNFKKPCVTTPP